MKGWARALTKGVFVALLLLAALKLSRGADTQGLKAIGIVDFYGLRTLSEAQLRQALQLKEGDSLPASDEQAHRRAEEAKQRLEALPGVIQARVNLVCCDADKIILYVGIEEEGSQSLHFGSAPQGKVRLPEDAVEAGKSFDKAFMEAIEKRDFAEDDSQGYALMHYPAARSVQERFVTIAAAHLRQLRDVLHNSADSGQRALAAQVIAYAPQKQAVVQDLVDAMKDPDSEVRNNAMRALWVMAEYAQQHSQLHIEIPTQPFIAMLNSIEWTDRNKSLFVLAQLTEKRDPAILADLRKQALPSLVEMAHWKARGHAQPAFFILGRLGGLSEEEIKSAWDRDPEAVFSAARRAAKAS
jgi:hypothetical protein